MFLSTMTKFGHFRMMTNGLNFVGGAVPRHFSGAPSLTRSLVNHPANSKLLFAPVVSQAVPVAQQSQRGFHLLSIRNLVNNFKPFESM